MGVKRSKLPREGKNVSIYLNREVKRGVELVNKSRVEDGLEALTFVQFTTEAVVEKIRRELPAGVRLPLRHSRGDKKYYLSDSEGETDGTTD